MKRTLANIAIMLGAALLTYITIIWIYPKAIEIGILIGR